MEFLKYKPEKLFFRFLIPCLGSALVMSIYTMTDAIVIGKGVSADGLAALNLITPILCIIFAGAILYGVGSSVHFSVKKGAGDMNCANEYFTAGLILLIIHAIVLLTVYKTGINLLLKLMGAEGDLYVYGYEYMDKYVWFVPIAATNTFLGIMLRADGDPKRAMAGTVGGGIVNIILDIIFVFPCKMGMGGAALASGTGMIIQFVILITHFISKNNGMKICWSEHGLKTAGKIFAGGISSFFNEFSNCVIVFVFNRQLIKYCGNDELAIYGVIVSYVILFNSLYTGVGQTIQPIISFYYGASKCDEIHKIRKCGFITITVMMILFSLCGVIFPKTMCGIFIKMTDSLNKMAGSTLGVYFLAFIFMGYNILTTYYMQSILKELRALILSLLRNFVLCVVFLLLLPLWFGGKSLWYVMPIVEVIAFFVGRIMIVGCKINRNALYGGNNDN